MHRLSALHSSSKSGASGCKKGCEKETSNASNNYNENRSFLDVFFCGDILESRRRKYCPAPKHCKSRATYERTFRSLGLWRGPNRIEQLKKWLLTSRRDPTT